MKFIYSFKKLAYSLLIILFAFDCVSQTTITEWDFEGDVSTPVIGNGIASLIGGTTATFANGFEGGRAWNTSGYPAQGTGAATAGVEFEVSTSGYASINAIWDQRHSNTSANRIRLQYTLNGTTWINFEATESNATNAKAGVPTGFDNGRYIADAGDTWYQRSANLSSIAGANNNPLFAVRMVTEFVDGANYGPSNSTSTYGPAGTLRYDNVKLTGIAGSNPVITAAPQSIIGFEYLIGNGPSDPQVSMLNAYNLTPSNGNVTVTVSSDYEASTNGTTFGNSIAIPYTNGTFPSGNVNLSIRLKAGLNSGFYDGSIILSGGGASEVEITLSGSVTSSALPALTEVILPKFIEGATPSNINRVPYAFWAKMTNLLPNATYRFFNKIVSSSDTPTSDGAGNCIFVGNDGTFTRTTSTSFNTAGQYGEFLTDGAGSFGGWFITEPTGNARFQPGKYIYMRLILNDGANGIVAVNRLTTTDSVRVIGFYQQSIDTAGTAIRGITGYTPKNFVLLYDNVSGTGRPLYGTHVEPCGVEFLSPSYSSFYVENVAGSEGAWGGIVPNVNANGVRRIDQRNIISGAIESTETSATGVWGSVDTRNPTGGIDNVIVLSSTIGINDSEPLDISIKLIDQSLLIERSETAPYSLEIYTLTGQEIFTGRFTGNSAQITLNRFNGVLLVHYDDGMQSKTFRLYK